MSSPRTAPLFKAPARRTNSLGSAKADCHTCSSMKKPCDRQRPQCGTCRREHRKCGGYVLDLVWKDRGSREAPSSTRSATRTIVMNSPMSPGNLVPSERQFKFKQGRPKMKRKPCKCSGVGAKSPAMPGPVIPSISTSHGSVHTTEESTRPGIMDEGISLQTTTAMEEYGTSFEHDEQSNTGKY